MKTLLTILLTLFLVAGIAALSFFSYQKHDDLTNKAISETETRVQMQQMKTTVTQMKSENDRLKKENSDLIAKIGQPVVAPAVTESSKEMQDIAKQVSEIASQKTEVKCSKTDSSSSVNPVQSKRISFLEAQNKSLKNELKKDQKSQLSRVPEKSTVSQQQIEDYKMIMRMQKGKMQQLQQENDTLRNKACTPQVVILKGQKQSPNPVTKPVAKPVPVNESSRLKVQNRPLDIDNSPQLSPLPAIKRNKHVDELN